METAKELTESQLTAKLMRAGISPKYKAFSYLLYLISHYDSSETIRMSNKELVDSLSVNFNVSNKRATANFRSLMEGCAYINGKKSAIFELMASLERNELPTVKEFLMAVECIILDS